MTVLESFAAGRADRERAKPRTSFVRGAATWVGRHTPGWSVVRTAALTVAGLGCLDYAAYQWHHVLGYAAAGVSLLVLEALGGSKR